MTSPIELRRMDWDSSHFGLEIVQLDRPPDSMDEGASAIRAAREQGADCVYCLVAADDYMCAWRLEAAGFVARDLRLEFQRRVDPRPLDAVPELRACTGADVDALADLSAKVFTRTRFAADPGFPRQRVTSLYDIWLRNSVSGYANAVLVSGAVGTPDGFVTLHASQYVARIGLIAVDASARGGGLGLGLVNGAMHWAAEHSCSELRVVTQGSNTAAQRLYQRCGFVTATAHTWFHAWPSRVRGPLEILP